MLENNYKVIIGQTKKKEILKKHRLEKRKEIYKELYFDYKYGLNHSPDKAKSVYYGVMLYCDLKSLSLDNSELRNLLQSLCEMQDIKTMISDLTYFEMINLFPIIKSYDGDKYCCKDYFSTISYLKEKNMHDKIGVHEIDNFFWNYFNYNIMNFSINEMLIMDRIQKFKHKKGLLESFIEEQGLSDKIHTYRYDKQNQVMIDNETGEEHSVKKPSNFNFVKNGDNINVFDKKNKIENTFTILNNPTKKSL